MTSINKHGFIISDSGIVPHILIKGPTKIKTIQHPSLNNPVHAIIWNDKPSNMVWTKGLLSISNQVYQVELSPAGDLGTYCRPYLPYDSFEFEDFFVFGSHCKGYSPEVIILIRNTFPI